MNSDRFYFRPQLSRRGRLMMAEAPRAVAQIAALAQSSPFLSLAPRGDGHPLLVMPGLGASDGSTLVLRTFLASLGYQAHAWKLGTNRGPEMEDLQFRLGSRLDEIIAASGGHKVSLVGWSLGGVYARLLARRYPGLVRQVITLGSPLGGQLRAPTTYRDGTALATIPSSAIFSKSDAIVPWQIAMQEPGEFAENIEVNSSHMGLGFSPAVLYAIADRLAQREQQWRPFRRRGWRRFVYGPALMEQDGPAANTNYANP